jgi:hypothetical protein
MFADNNYLYYLTIGLQAICAIHSLRRGTQGRWIWMIVFLPVIGCLAYLYLEVLPSRRISAPKLDITAVLNPSGKLKKLEDELKFTDTFSNKIKLADAYLETGHVDKAVALYESSLTGAFSENEHVLAKLIIAYSQQERYGDVINIAKKIYRLPQFARSKSHMLYAVALEHSGEAASAENEFKLMKGRYAYFEQRYRYGQFLMRQGRDEDAYIIFSDIVDEVPHLSQMEKKSARLWSNKAKEELKKLAVS